MNSHHGHKLKMAESGAIQSDKLTTSSLFLNPVILSRSHISYSHFALPLLLTADPTQKSQTHHSDLSPFRILDRSPLVPIPNHLPLAVCTTVQGAFRIPLRVGWTSHNDRTLRNSDFTSSGQIPKESFLHIASFSNLQLHSTVIVLFPNRSPIDTFCGVKK
jgi:hypothetical protein